MLARRTAVAMSALAYLSLLFTSAHGKSVRGGCGAGFLRMIQWFGYRVRVATFATIFLFIYRRLVSQLVSLCPPRLNKLTSKPQGRIILLILSNTLLSPILQCMECRTLYLFFLRTTTLHNSLLKATQR